MVSISDLLSPGFWSRRVRDFFGGVEYGDSRFSVTELSGCLRRAYYDRVVGAETGDREVLLMFYGFSVHAFIPRVLGDGFVYERKIEYSFNTKYNSVITVVGRVDAFSPDLGVVVEFKTTDKLPDKPVAAHERQLQYYLALMNAGTGVLVYWSRDRVRPFLVKRRQGVLEELERRATRLWLSLRFNNPPRPEPENAYPYCTFCPYFIMGKCKPFERVR